MKYKDLNAKQREYLAGRCRHNMIRETCGACNKFEYTEGYKFPLEFEDETTGKKKRVFIRGTRQCVDYKTWR